MKERKDFLTYLAIAALASVLLASRCREPTVPNTTQPTAGAGGSLAVTDPLTAVAERMKDPNWRLQTDPFKDTVPIPQAGGLEYAPAEALGYVWGLAIAGGQDATKTCLNTTLDSGEGEHIVVMPLGRYWNNDPSQCQAKPIPEQVVSEIRMTAGLMAKTTIGPFLTLDGSGDTAIEMIVSHPTHVTWVDAQKCRPTVQIADRPFQKMDRICKLLWVNNVKQTKLFYKEYTNVKVAGDGGFSLIKLGTEAYSTSSSMKSATVLSGNYEDITAFVTRDESTGYIFRPVGKTVPSNAVPTKIDEATANLLDRVSRGVAGGTKVVSIASVPSRLKSPTSAPMLAPKLE